MKLEKQTPANSTDNVQSLTNAEEANKQESGNKLVEIEPIKGTPFALVELKGEAGGYFISIGNSRITDILTQEDALEKVYNHDWEIITGLIVKIYETMKEEDRIDTLINNLKTDKNEEKQISLA